MDITEIARKWFNGLYCGDPKVVDEFADESIVLSYPIFQKLFNKPVLQGKDEVKQFVNSFNKKWTEPEITIHESVQSDKLVVLVWSFQAIDRMSDSNSIHKWGGISLVRFNNESKIVSEIGEESEPGPFNRLTSDL